MGVRNFMCIPGQLAVDSEPSDVRQVLVDVLGADFDTEDFA
jgi:hypothetical protein